MPPERGPGNPRASADVSLPPAGVCVRALRRALASPEGAGSKSVPHCPARGPAGVRGEGCALKMSTLHRLTRRLSPESIHTHTHTHLHTRTHTQIRITCTAVSKSQVTDGSQVDPVCGRAHLSYLLKVQTKPHTHTCTHAHTHTHSWGHHANETLNHADRHRHSAPLFVSWLLGGSLWGSAGGGHTRVVMWFGPGCSPPSGFPPCVCVSGGISVTGERVQ